MEDWLLHDEFSTSDGQTLRKSCICIALTCAVKSLLNSRIAEIDANYRPQSRSQATFQP